MAECEGAQHAANRADRRQGHDIAGEDRRDAGRLSGDKIPGLDGLGEDGLDTRHQALAGRQRHRRIGHKQPLPDNVVIESKALSKKAGRSTKRQAPRFNCLATAYLATKRAKRSRNGTAFVRAFGCFRYHKPVGRCYI